MTAVSYGQIWEDGTGRRVRILSYRSPGPAGIWQNGSRACVENVNTGRRSTVLLDTKGRLRRYRLVDTCDRCATPGPKHLPCCSSHGRVLCCSCYRRSHFVETGCDCCADGRAARAAFKAETPRLGDLGSRRRGTPTGTC